MTSMRLFNTSEVDIRNGKPEAARTYSRDISHLNDGQRPSR